MMDEAIYREIIDTLIGSGYDSNVIQFKKLHKESIDEMLVSLQNGCSEIQQFETTILRNSFLYACARYTR